MGEDLIQVNWDTHKQILFGNLNTLREEQIHTDVTLCCDGNFYPAHKLVLTMCSGYFAKAFQYAGNSSPIFFLCGIKKETLESLLAFIYNGTVTIPSGEVEAVAKAGTTLQIQELSQIASVISSKAGIQFSNDDLTIQQNSSRKKLEPMVLLEKDVIDQIIKESADISEEQKDQHTESMTDTGATQLVIQEENHGFEDSQDGNSSDYEFEGWDPSSIKKPKAIARSLFSILSAKKNLLKKKICFKCKSQFDCQSELVEHFTTDHKNMMKKHYCKRCKKIFKFKKVFQKHRLMLNCDRKFCKECSYSSLSFEDFRTHLQSHRNKSEVADGNKIPNGVDLMETRDSMQIKFGDPCKRKRKFSNKALHDALKAISTDFEKFADIGSACYDEYDVDECSSTENTPPTKIQKRLFSCSCCKLKFDSSREFNSHKQTVCKLLECPFCLKVFIREKKDMLEDHKKMHDSLLKPYSCPYCTYSCDDQLARDHHLDKHSRKD